MPGAPGPCGLLALGSVMPLNEIKLQPGRWQALGDKHLVGSWGGNDRLGIESWLWQWLPTLGRSLSLSGTLSTSLT